MANLYLSIGSNLGTREENLTQAIERIGKTVGKIQMVSSFVETNPVGFLSENRFLNCCVLLETNLSPFQCLSATQEIERAMGRGPSRDGEYHDRSIDIDLLLYDNAVMCSEKLTIPHPRMTSRYFVLAPLTEIDPGLVHPQTHKTIGQHLAELNRLYQ